jgi:hypothetical protein
MRNYLFFSLSLTVSWVLQIQARDYPNVLSWVLQIQARDYPNVLVTGGLHGE